MSDPLLILAIVVVAGLLGGAAARRLGVAGVTGQILAGLLLGHAGFDLFSEEDVASLQPVTHFALGLITLVVGGHLNLRRLHNSRRRHGLLLVAETTLIPLLVLTLVVGVGGEDWRTGLLLASIAIATAPATVVAIMAETRSRGVFVKTLVGAVAFNNIACILVFELVYVVVRSEGTELSVMDVLGRPAQTLALAALIGGALGALLVVATRRVITSDKLATASVITVLLASGIANALGVSQLLTCLFLGVTLANLTPEKDEIVESAFVNVRDAIFAIFFTLAGLHLQVDQLAAAGGLAALVFLGRTVGKVAAAGLALKLVGAPTKLRRYMGLALLPQAGVAVGLLLIVRDEPAFADIGGMVLTAGLAVVAANELVGPFATRWALKQAGEIGKDRARLIDFLHEENIIVGMLAETKEEAIRSLVDVLIHTNRLDANREELLASVLEREREMSTCFGSGLAVPHGILPEGSEMVGVMGLSQQGLAFDTPDGQPVHCMVVLATPVDQRGRHLQVLAALAKAVGTDPNVQRQLFNAQSSAHAYEILHAEEAEDFNYFLEDDET